MVTISELEATSEHRTVYKRADGQLYIMLNAYFHVKTKLSESGKTWLGDGNAEKLDPNERVEVVA